LPLLIVLSFLLCEKLVAYQRSGDQPYRPADQSADGRMTDGAADDAPSGSSPENADAGAFFSRAQRPAGAAHADERRNRTCRKSFSKCCVFQFESSFFYNWIGISVMGSVPLAGMAQKVAQHIGDQRVDFVFIFGNHEGLFCQSRDQIPQSGMDNSFYW
jgi:hypothetical protein